MHHFWHGRQEIRELRARMDQAFRMAQQQAPCQAAHLAPPVDFAAEADAFEITLDLPGVKREHLDVKVEHGALIVSGDKQAVEHKGARLLRRERSYGTFCRTIPLPDEADLSQVTAKLSHGELHVRVGRQAEATPRRVEVVVE